MDNLAQRKPLAQTRHNLLVYKVLHLEWHTRERDYYAPLALEPHTRSGAVSIV